MKSLRNLPDYPEYLKELMIAVDNQSSAKKILCETKCDINLLTYGEGAKEYSECFKGDVLYLGIEGVATLTLDGTDYDIAPGQVMAVEGDMPHSLKGEEAYKIVQIITEV